MSLDFQPDLDFQLDFEPDGEPSAPQESFGDQALRSLRTGFAEAGNAADTGVSMAAAGIAGLFGGNQDKLFKELDERVASRQSFANPDKKGDLPLGASLIGTVGTLPIAIMGSFLDAGASAGKRAIDVGESASTAGKIAGVGTVGTMVSAALPIAGKGYEWWRRALQGAFGNTIQTWATKTAQRAHAETSEGKKEFTPTAKELAEAAILGAGFGASVRKPPQSRLKEIESKLDAIQKETPVPKPVPVEDLPPTQLELPLSTSPEAIAERQGRGTGQPDLFFSEQANMDAMGNGAMAEAQARSRAAQTAFDASQQEAAQRALMARQQALEAEVASRVGEEQIAAQRAATLAQGTDALRRTDTGYEQHMARQEAEAGIAAGQRPLLQHQDAIDFTPHGDRPAQFGMTDTGGRVDEHGIPIRADLSMEAQNLQNPLQRNLWGDELPGRTGDGGLPLTRALDSMPPGPERTRAIGSLSGAGDIGRALEDAEIAKRSGVGVGGPRGAQRGAIDIKGVKRALEDLRLGLIRGPDALRAFVGTYDAQMDHKDISKGIGGGHIGWFPAIKDSRDLKSEGRLVWMSPADFHAAALPRHMDSTKKTGIGERKRDQIRIGINDPGGLSSVPVLRLNEMGKIIGHEGRHRMDVMRELGVAKAPVYLHTNGHTNADGPLKHLAMISEDGTKKVQIPETIFPMGTDPLGFAPKTPVGQSGLGMGHGLQRGAADFGIVEGLQKRFKELDDVVAAVQTALPPKTQDIISSALKEGRDGKGLDLLEAGGVMTAEKRNSSLIRDVVRVKQHFMAAAERQIKDVVFPYEKAVRGLSRTEIVELSGVLKKEMFAGSEIPMKDLADAGFSEKQLLAYQKLRKMTNTAWEQQNQRRVAAGELPLTRMEAYLNSQWQGVHRRAIKDAKGRTVWFLASDSKVRLEHDTKKLLKQFPDLVPEKPFMAQKSRGGNDLHQIYATMMDVMGDDPAFAKVKHWYEANVADTAEGALGQERFFERKYKVRGFIGDRPLTLRRTEFSEALGLLQMQANYAKSAFKWTALQDAHGQLKKVFSNKDLQAQQPNNMTYAKKYFMHQFGANEATWIKSMEDALDKSMPWGLTTSNQLSRGIGNMKAVWTAQKLALSTGYAIANVFQLPQAIPYMVDIQVKHGGNPLTALALGGPLGLMLAAQHQINPANFGLHKMLVGLPKEQRTFFAQAMKYAEDNQVVLSSAADEAPISKSFGALAMTKRVSDKTIAVPDSLRSLAFMTFASQLHSSGKFDTPTALRMAHEYTVRSMVDFREGERAMAFDKAGLVGNMANTLQSYSVNYFQQWNWAIREVGRKNPLPLLAMIGVQGAVGGAMGLPGFASIDKGIEWIKDLIKESNPVLWKKIRDFSLSDMVLKAGGSHGEKLLYGAASKNPADVSIATRVQAPAVEEMLQVPLAPAADLGNTALSMGKALADPMNQQKRAQALYNMAPSGVQGLLETSLFADNIGVPAAGGRMVARPKDMADPTGMFFRSDKDADVRKWGVRSQTEVFQRDQAYKANKRAIDSQSVLTALPKKIYNAARTNNANLPELVSLYVELSPGVKTPKDVRAALTQMFENQIMRENTSSADRLITGKTTFEGVLAYKRFQEAMKRAGYVE